MTRRPHWDVRLFAYIEGQRSKPFAWGTHDCVTFAIGAIKAMRGVQGLAIPRYDTALGAMRALKRAGFASLEAAVDAQLPRLGTPLMARRGDIAMQVDGALGVVIGSEVVFVGPEGLVRQPLRSCHIGWMV